MKASSLWSRVCLYFQRAYAKSALPAYVSWFNRNPAVGWGLVGCVALAVFGLGGLGYLGDFGVISENDRALFRFAVVMSLWAVCAMMVDLEDRLISRATKREFGDTLLGMEILFALLAIMLLGLVAAIAAIGTELAVFWWSAALSKGQSWLKTPVLWIDGILATLVCLGALITGPGGALLAWFAAKRRLQRHLARGLAAAMDVGEADLSDRRLSEEQ